MALEITSRNIEGIADLVVRAPIKQGFIDAFQNVTYETRLRLATQAFYELRRAAREHEMIKPFADVAERIQSLLAFRIGILDTRPTRSLILAATFDRAWEPYIRLIWNPLGTFLDVLFCNCEGYVTAYDHSFPDYAAWVRANQADSMIFYASTPATVSDQLYLAKLERLQREGRTSELDLARMIADDPEAEAAKLRSAATAGGSPGLRQEFLTLASEALVVLYGLADYYPPDKPHGDGKYLLRAARDLFGGWDTTDPVQLPPLIRGAHPEAFAWLETSPPAAPTWGLDPPLVRGEVQAGVLRGYDHQGALVKHGCLLLMGVTDAAAARRFLDEVLPEMAFEDGSGPNSQGAFLNIAITKRGLQNLGVADEDIARLPKEFRDGMDERAGLLGDIHRNHPRRWPLPERFLRAASGPSPRPPVELSEVDIVLQLRTAAGGWDFHDLPNDEVGLSDSAHPLAESVRQKLAQADNAGIRLLSIEPMRRLRADTDQRDRARDHFGFLDFVSQPSLKQDEPTAARDGVSPGELLLGYANDRSDPPPPPDPLLDNGTFMVIRKLSQDVEALETFLDNPGGANPVLRGPELLAKMTGRTRQGAPLASAGTPEDNDFDFATDPGGDLCPLQAHIRRANPRLPNVHPPAFPLFGRPVPRLMRRGMSYGPDYAGEDTAAAKRGIVFIAYNASLAEQFEVIQRWMNGGNITNIAAPANDALLGVHPLEGPKIFRFPHGDAVARVEIAKPFVGVEWGLYAFVPSRTALTRLARSAPERPTIGDASRGEMIIQDLARLSEDDAKSAWKVYLEDFTAKDPAERADTPDIWAAIRDHHGGLLRIPGAVLVASNDLVQQVFVDSRRRYSVGGQNERMRRSFGEIYVGLDPGERYEREAAATNAIVGAISIEQAFEVAEQIASRALALIFEGVAGLSADLGAAYPAEIDLHADFIVPTLEYICNYWFGLPDAFAPGAPPPATAGPTPSFVEAGGWSWDSAAGRAPRCPGDFMAPSRYCFYPDPTEAIAGYGIVQGAALRATARRYIDTIRPGADGGAAIAPTGRLTAAMCQALDDNDLVARNLIGIMVGALPPLDANLRFVLYEWIKEKTLWRHQDALALGAAADRACHIRHAIDQLLAPMKAAMQKRPAPDLLWRTALAPHTLGGARIETGDKLILGVVSATLEKFNAADHGDVSAIFGGLATTTPRAIHACPAYRMAIGTMLGVLSALLECGRIEALPGALLVRLTPR